MFAISICKYTFFPFFIRIFNTENACGKVKNERYWRFLFMNFRMKRLSEHKMRMPRILNRMVFMQMMERKRM